MRVKVWPSVTPSVTVSTKSNEVYVPTFRLLYHLTCVFQHVRSCTASVKSCKYVICDWAKQHVIAADIVYTDCFQDVPNITFGKSSLVWTQSGKIMQHLHWICIRSTNINQPHLSSWRNVSSNSNPSLHSDQTFKTYQDISRHGTQPFWPNHGQAIGASLRGSRRQWSWDLQWR